MHLCNSNAKSIQSAEKNMNQKAQITYCSPALPLPDLIRDLTQSFLAKVIHWLSFDMSAPTLSND
jgi:hypothetical protein